MLLVVMLAVDMFCDYRDWSNLEPVTGTLAFLKAKLKLRLKLFKG